jgi:hypothetical protein
MPQRVVLRDRRAVDRHEDPPVEVEPIGIALGSEDEQGPMEMVQQVLGDRTEDCSGPAAADGTHHDERPVAEGADVLGDGRSDAVTLHEHGHGDGLGDIGELLAQALAQGPLRHTDIAG